MIATALPFRKTKNQHVRKVNFDNGFQHHMTLNWFLTPELNLVIIVFVKWTRPLPIQNTCRSFFQWEEVLLSPKFRNIIKQIFLSVLNWDADLLKRFFKKNVNNYVILPVKFCYHLYIQNYRLFKQSFLVDASQFGWYYFICIGNFLEPKNPYL